MGVEEVFCRGGDECKSRVHLCNFIDHVDDDEKVRSMVRGAVYYCKNCGRSAREERYLCRPSRIGAA